MPAHLGVHKGPFAAMVASRRRELNSSQGIRGLTPHPTEEEAASLVQEAVKAIVVSHEEDMAATKMQAVQRGKASRAETEQLMEAEAAAVVQGMVREIADDLVEE